MTDENKNIEYQNESDRHEYDGIKENHNPAPNWIVFVFLATICFALIYLVINFGYPDNGRDQITEYNRKLAEFEVKRSEMLAESAEAASGLSEAEIIEAGKALYDEQNCASCHGSNGEGAAVGPNLTDNSWIHGCSPEDVIHIIKEGNPVKGMLSYKSSLSDIEIEHLSTYILNSLLGSNPEGAKEAQGEKCN